MERGLRASALVSKPVCFRDIRLGVVVDVLLDEPVRRVVGLDVLCGDRVTRFLPWPACEVGEDGVSVASALVLMAREVDFYRRGGRSIGQVRRFPVTRAGAEVGVFADLVLDDDGSVRELVLLDGPAERTLEPEPGLRFGPDALRPAV